MAEPPNLPCIPDAPRAIRKGVPLKTLLDRDAVVCLARNIQLVYPGFDAASFRDKALSGLEPLGLMARGKHIALALRRCLPDTYRDAVRVLLDSLTPPQIEADEFGLAEFFYLPHSSFIADYGIAPEHNRGQDPFDVSMHALYELTLRFTAEFAIRSYLTHLQDRTLSRIMAWVDDPNPHVRRLCSEGTRPRLPWGSRIPALISDPTPTLPILEILKNDPSPYVRRSVANHLGDIAKDHPELVIETCRHWLEKDSSDDLRRLVRHAIRYLLRKHYSAQLERLLKETGLAPRTRPDPRKH